MTTPAFAELYYGLGMLGLIAMLPIGMMHGWIERRYHDSPSAMRLLLVLLCLASIPIGLHTNLRSMTRPLIYCLYILAGTTVLRQLSARA